MKKDIAPEVLAFLKNLPISYAIKQNGTITGKDEAWLKIMLSNATDSITQTEREALKQYIFSGDFEHGMPITDADRKKIAEYLRKYAPEFYKSLLKSTS